jgi:hypothetical protein
MRLMKTINRIIGIISLTALYFIGKEFLSLYVRLKELHIIAALAFLIIIGLFLIFYAIIPVARIIALPRFEGPAMNRWNEKRLIKKRMKRFRKNSYLKKSGYDFNQANDDAGEYQKIIKIFDPEIANIRKRYIRNLFLSTAIAQNGFVDGVLILSFNLRVIREIFTLYGGRATYKDIWVIARNVYYSIAIGGSEGVEFVIEELFEKLGSSTVKAVPFLGKVMSSVTDGYVNAMLLARVAMITENYCRLTYIQSSRDLFPRAKVLADTTSALLKPILDMIGKEFRKLVRQKPRQVVQGIFDKLKSQKEIEDNYDDIFSKSI